AEAQRQANTPAGGLPAPGQVAMPMGEGGRPMGDFTPEVQAAIDNANAVYSARDAVEAARQPAHQIAIDPADPIGSIAKIAAAPVTEVTGSAGMPAGLDLTAHSNAAGDLAAQLLHSNALERGAKLAPKEARDVMLKQAEDIRQQARGSINDYAAQYG